MQAYPDPPPARAPLAPPMVAGSESRSVGAEAEQEVINRQGGAQVIQEGARGQGGARVKTSTAKSERAHSYDEELKPASKLTTEVESMAIESQAFPEAAVEGGLTAFSDSSINWSAKALFSGILGAALLPFFGPVVAIGVSLSVMAAVTQIQENLEPLDLGLQDDTVRKLVEPLQGKVLDESELRKVIEEVLSEDRPANEDLAKAFIKLLPTIQEAAATNIEFSGPVQGLTIGDHNTVTQTFNGFLQDGL